jgi:flavorubredoxin
MDLVSSKTEFLKNIYRLSLAPNEHFEFNQFLIVDDKVCLVHAGKSSLFKPLFGQVKEILGNKTIDYIVFSHFEADECGAVNEWLAEYPEAVVYCNKICNINLSDFLIRPACVLKDGEVLSLGKRSLELVETAHFPHNWDAHMWYEQSDAVLFSSDYCCHGGISKPVIESDNSNEIIQFYERGQFIPYGKSTLLALDKISKYEVNVIAPMHGSVVVGANAKVVLDTVKVDLSQKSST